MDERGSHLSKPHPPTDQPTKERTTTRLLLCGLLLLYILPVWWFPFFPSQDGPAHLENAAILREYYLPDRAQYREYYVINSNPDPNWLSHVLLAGLMCLVPPLVAEKVLLTGYLVALPLSVRYALVAVRPDSGYLTVLIFPFLGNLFYHMGFYNFCYSLPVFFVVVGNGLRHRDASTVRRAVVLALLSLVLFFCHLVSFAAAWLVIGLMLLWDAIREFTGGARGTARPRQILIRRAALPFLALVPSAILAALFLGRQGLEPASEAGPSNRLGGLVALESLVSYDILEGLVSLALACGFGALVLVFLAAKARQHQWGRGDELLAASGGLLAVYLLAPQNLAGGMFLDLRLNLFPFFLLLLWFGAQTFGPNLKRTIQAMAVACSLALLCLHTAHYAELNEYLAEYVSVAEHLQPGRTLLPLSYSHAGHSPDGKPLSLRVGPFLHAAGYLAVDKHLIDLKNYEATTGYFPIHYRPNLNPFLIMGQDPTVPGRGLHSQLPRVHIARYEEETGRTVDYVLVWGARPDQQGDSLHRQLGDRYRLIYTSSPRGLLRLYERV